MTRIALAAALLVAGCAASTPPAAAGSPRERIAYARAECMRDKGFTYTPFLPTFPPPTAEEQKISAGDYAALRAYRQRYGYAIFSELVYPDDPAGGGQRTSVNDDANSRYVAQLNSAQAAEWNAADTACYAQAVERVIHRRVKDLMDRSAQTNADMDREEARVLDTDPRLVSLARTYAACMRAKGYKIPSAAPSKIVSVESDRFWQQSFELGRRDMGTKAVPGHRYAPQLTPRQARPYLDKEIASALDDLECGKDFFPVFNPRQQTLWDQVAYRWGVS